MRIPARKKLPASFITLLSLIFVWSCIDTDQYKVETLTASPEESIPLAFGSLSINDILSQTDSTYIKSYPDGLVYLMYEKSTESSELQAKLKLQPQHFSPAFPGLPAGPLAAGFSVPVQGTFAVQPSDQKLQEIGLKQGDLALGFSFSPNLPANISSNLQIEVTFPSLKKNGTALHKILTAGSTVNEPLKDYVMQLTDNSFDYDISINVLANVNIPSATDIAIEVDFSNLDFRYVKGFLGQNIQPTVLPEASIDISAFGTSLHGAKISFDSAKIQYIITNEYGVPITIDFNPLEVRKGGVSTPILFKHGNPVAIGQPLVMGDDHSDTLEVDDPAKYFNIAPDQFAFGVKLKINDGITDGTNFVIDTSKLKVKLHAELPIYGSASGIVLGDTFKLDFSNLKDSKIQSAILHSKVRNELPLDAYMQIYFTDDNFHVIDSVFSEGSTALIKGSTVTSSGNLKSAGEADLDISVGEAKLSNMLLSKKLIVKMSMNTSKASENVQVKFKSSYKINLSLGLEAKLKLQVDINN
jgi:hypothetical protein